MGIATAAPRAADSAAKGPNSYIVTLSAGDPDGVAKRHERRYGASVDHVFRHALRGYSAHMSPTAAARIAADAGVESVIPDRVITLAPPPGKGKPSPSPEPSPDPEPTPSQLLPTGIDRIDADLSSVLAGDGAGSVDVDVAVLDTGIDTRHPDLNVVGGINCSTGRSYGDKNGHGTHVAGTIGAADDAAGVVGVAPGARLWSVRVLDNGGSGSWSSIICGLDWVTANADTIEVANMSLGGGGSEGHCNDGGLHEAVCNAVDAGVTFTVAAGNEASNAAGSVPAAYDEVITVSALADFDGAPGGLGSATCRADEDDTFASFSNYGADVDLIAPGVCITSTWKGGGYETISGTSMASPHVAGAAALWLAANPGASPAQVKAALLSAGNTNWFSGDDPDGITEPLLDVSSF